MAATKDEAAKGAHQNIARATLVLDALAHSGNDGLRLTDVSRITGLSKTAAHRCLAGLVDSGLASFDPPRSLFFLGDRILAWVGVAGQRFAIAERVKPYLQRVADTCGDTVYFSVRRGDEAVCFGRAEGSYPIRTLTLSVGDRRPLGIGSGSLAIMAALPEAEIQRLLDTQSGPRSAYPVSEELLRTMLADARESGFSTMDGYLIPGMSGVGVAVRDPSGTTKAALSIAAITERVNPPRLDELLGWLRAESERLTRELPDLLTAL
jgi:DNA-binding IclR family transcriptional regulator